MREYIYKNRFLKTICLLFIFINPLQAQLSENSQEYPTIFQLVTNCPPISDLILKYKFGQQPVELYEFKYQSNAFFFRVTTNASFTNGFSLKETQGGYFESNYWYYAYNPPPQVGLMEPPPILNTYVFDSNDVYSTAYQSVDKNLLSRFRLFTSLGVAGDGAPGSLRLDEDNNIVYDILRQKITIMASLTYSNSLPVQANVKITTPDGKIHTQNIYYNYKLNIAAGSIPAHIRGSGSSIEVMKLVFAHANMPLSKEEFLPPLPLMSMSNLTRAIHSNLTEYMYFGGQLISKVADAQSARFQAEQELEKNLKSGMPTDYVDNSPNRRWYVLAIMFGFSAVVFTVLIRGKIKQK